MTVALSVLLLCSASLNVAQYVGGARGGSATSAPLGAAPKLGWGPVPERAHAFARMEDPPPRRQLQQRPRAHVHRPGLRGELRDRRRRDRDAALGQAADPALIPAAAATTTIGAGDGGSRGRR